MPDIPQFHFRIPPLKIKRVVKPTWDYQSVHIISEHILGNKKMSVYQANLYDINRNGYLGIEELLYAIKTVNDLTVVSVIPAPNIEAGETIKKGYSIGASTPGGAIGGGGGGSGGY